jgi:large subunit ribosomal protein L24
MPKLMERMLMDANRIRIKKEDKVKVLAGKDKGKIGKVLKIDKKTNRVVVENINVAKRHQKPNQKAPQGGMIDKFMPIAVSNLMIICNSCVKPTRIGIKQLEDGKRVRICKKCDQQIDS